MPMSTGRPMGRRRKLTAEQHKQIAERSFLYMRLRLEAAKHSQHALAREFGISESTLRAYLNRRVA